MKVAIANSKDGGNLYDVLKAFFHSVKNWGGLDKTPWTLSSSYTDVEGKVFITEFSNGKVFIRAHSENGVHTYSYGKVSED